MQNLTIGDVKKVPNIHAILSRTQFVRDTGNDLEFLTMVPHHFTSEAGDSFPFGAVHFYQPGRIAARDDLLRQQLERNVPLNATDALRIAGATVGKPGTYLVESHGRVYGVRIKGQIEHEGTMYGILTSIVRY